MAFDMYFDNTHERIEHQEEFIFSLANLEKHQFPELTTLWDVFYNSPIISASQAGVLVHELIALLSQNGGIENRQLAYVVVRLLPFFSRAYCQGHEIRSISD